MITVNNNYDCEKCLNKSICKYYEECKYNSNKDLFIKNSKNRKEPTENLTLSITCKYYKTEVTSTLNYNPYTLKDFEPYFNPNNTGTGYSVHPTDITISNTYSHVDTKNNDSSQESSRNVSTIITSKKHI